VRPVELAFDGPPGIPLDERGSVVTVGTFDGVHRGHRAVLEEIGRRARETGRRSVLVTFHPHPLAIVRPEIAPPLLTTPDEKKEILAESGLDWAVFVRFTPAVSRLSPRAFVEEILVRRIGVRELVIGYDHGFGRDRSGDAATLRAMGAELGFAVDVVGPVHDGEAAISSTRIRAAVAEGRVHDARTALGRPYAFHGAVVRGDGRGASLGFPTANLQVAGEGKLLPPPGVYAARAVLPAGSWPAALHVGPRPTFEGSLPTVEVHLMDFQGDLYGERMRVDLVRRIRDVVAFPSVEALVARMGEDVAEARRILSAEAPFTDGTAGGASGATPAEP
jgi:riboflavin kinase/FMN adenylyltransferase